MTAKPPTLKSTNVRIDMIVRVVRRAVFSAALIGVGMILAIVVFMRFTSREQGRVCDAVEAAFKAHDDVFYPKLTERQPPLPPRTAEDQERINKIIGEVRAATDAAIAGAC